MAGDVGPAAVTTALVSGGLTDPAGEPARSNAESIDAATQDGVVGRRSRLWGVAGSPVRLALAVGLVVVVGVAALAAWLGSQAHRQHQQDLARMAYLQVGRQAAVDLTSVDYTRVEADVHRVLAASTGTFHDDFERRSPPFIQEVLRTRTKSVGTVAEAGVESADGVEAKVLVAVKVTTTRAGSADQRVKGWRMRIIVQRVGSDIKVANVEMIR